MSDGNDPKWGTLKMIGRLLNKCNLQLPLISQTQLFCLSRSTERIAYACAFLAGQCPGALVAHVNLSTKSGRESIKSNYCASSTLSLPFYVHDHFPYMRITSPRSLMTNNATDNFSEHSNMIDNDGSAM